MANAEEMISFLKTSIQMTDDTKEYYLVDQEATTLARATSRAESRIVGCKAAHKYEEMANCQAFHGR